MLDDPADFEIKAGEMAVSVDPGLEGGWALWRGKFWLRCIGPVATGLVLPTEEGDWEERLESTIDGWRDVVADYSIHTAVFEWPQLFESAGGKVVARSEGLVKLAVATGRIEQVFREDCVQCYFVRVPRWKGQMKKGLVKRRIRKKLGKSACADFEAHIWDAVGIGLWAKGFF